MEIGKKIPLIEETTTSVFAALVLAEPYPGNFYTDISGRFPFTSNGVMKYMLIRYAYDTNEILVKLNKKEFMHTCYMHMMSYMTHYNLQYMHQNLT